VSDSLARLERYLLAASVVLTGCVFLPSLADPVNVIKLTLLALVALACLATASLRVIRTRTITVPRSPGAWAALSVCLGFLISAATAPDGTRALIGTYGRNSGLIAYGAALVLFWLGLRAWSATTGHILALALVASGAFTAGYGLLQYAGIDPVNWSNPFNPVIGALGNPDFASAYLGMCAPAAAWGALWTAWNRWWRVASGVVAVACVVAALLSHAVLGPLAAAAGLVVLVGAVLLERGGAAARRGLGGLAGLALVGLAILVAGAARLGPAAPIFRRVSFQARQHYWDGAWEMFQRRPLVGIGLDHYGAYWREVRSDAATRLLGGSNFSDAAHSVPLQMLAQGGLVLGVTYAAFVVAVAVSLVRGLMRLAGPARLLLGGIGGTWVAYVVSSTVSIDQVPLLTVEFVTGGAVMAIAGLDWRVHRLPGALAVVANDKQRRGRGPAVARERAVTGADIALASGAAVALLVVAWFMLTPMRANAAVRTGDRELAGGDGNAALDAYKRANALLPAEGAYWEKTGFLYETVKLPQLATEAYETGARHDRFDVALFRHAARLTEADTDAKKATAYWKRAAELDPTNPETVAPAALFLAAHGDPEGALTMLARPLGLFPDNAELWAATGDARMAARDVPGARRAYERSLEIQPENLVAKTGLARLNE
jgi:O-antigen ligase